MKKHFILFISILFYYSLLPAQTIEWQKSYGGSSSDIAYCIRQTHEKGYIIGGSASSTNGDVTGNHGLADYWVVKINAMGLLEWEKSFGGSGSEILYSIEKTFDRGYIIGGFTQSNDGQVTGSHGGDDYWIVKIDSAGSLQWQKALGGSSMDEAMCVKQTKDKGYIIAGETYSNDGDVSANHGAIDYWIVKLDSAGSMQWQKTLGGSESDNASSILQTADGGYVIAGITMSNDGDVSGNHGLRDFWVVKLDTIGNIKWQKSFGGSSYDGALYLKQTIDNGFIIVGYTQSNDGDVTGYHGGTAYDGWVIKIDSTGVLQWQKTLGGSNDDVAQDVEQTNDGGYIIFCYTKSNDGDVTFNHGKYDYWIIKLDSSGNIQGEKTFGGTNDEMPHSILKTDDGNYIMAGLSNSTDGDVTGNHGSWDYWIVKISADLGMVDYAENYEMSFFPNPTSDIINIQTPQLFGKTKKLEIYDCMGQLKVKRTDISQDLDISFLTSGLYFIVLTNFDNERLTSKIIKE